MRLIDIFTAKKSIETEQKTQQENSDASIAEFSATLQAQGTRDAGYCGGLPTALLPNLQAIYMRLVKIIQGDEKKQNERKNETKQEITVLEAKNRNLDNQIKNEQEKLKHEETKIDEDLKKITNIRNNPTSVTGDSFTKASFWIGTVIIIFLTVYLFVFYSSASYSAFFKNFTPDDDTITQAIFDGQAIKKAWTGHDNGLMTVIFILAIPFIFLGLGYLIHKFSEEKKFSGYLKISGLIVVTFIFDFIIAYAIVKELQMIAVMTDLTGQTKPINSISEVFQHVNFWIIIFAGFVVYIIWGLVFDFIMKEYNNMDRVRYEIRQLEEKLSERRGVCRNSKEKIAELQTQKNSNEGIIDKLTIKLETFVVYFSDVNGSINNYFSGWVNYMQNAHLPKTLIEESASIKEKFLNDLENVEFTKKLIK